MKRKHTSEYILRTIMHVTDQKRKIEEGAPADTLKISRVHLSNNCSGRGECTRWLKRMSEACR